MKSADDASDDASDDAIDNIAQMKTAQMKSSGQKVTKEEQNNKEGDDPIMPSMEKEESKTDSQIADVLDKLQGIPQREAGREQLNARVTELIDELEEHICKLKEENNRLLEAAFWSTNGWAC